MSCLHSVPKIESKNGQKKITKMTQGCLQFKLTLEPKKKM